MNDSGDSESPAGHPQDIPYIHIDSTQIGNIYRGLLRWLGDVNGVPVDLTAGPLAGIATNYATLRYICYGGDRPVLCDKGDLLSPIEPPLAVDPEGNYIIRKDIIKYSGRDIAVSQTTSELQAGVVAMLAVALSANMFTIFLLGIQAHYGRVSQALSVAAANHLHSAASLAR